jgi:hypothetical protein
MIVLSLTATEIVIDDRCFIHSRIHMLHRFNYLSPFLSPFPFRPLLTHTTMADSHSSFYKERLSSDAYTHFIDNVASLKTRALVFSEYKKDFKRDSKMGFIRQSNNGDAAPFKTWLFGEIAPRDVGTLHQASGNHYVGKRAVRFTGFVTYFFTCSLTVFSN